MPRPFHLAFPVHDLAAATHLVRVVVHQLPQPRGLGGRDAEGVVQILRNDTRGDAAPVMAAVGPMQFEVMQARMENEYNVETVTEPIPYSVARRTDAESAPELGRQRGVEIFTRQDGELIALFGDKWKLAFVEKEHPELTIEPLIAD